MDPDPGVRGAVAVKTSKRRKLEAAGWRVGSAADFLGLPTLGLRHYTYGGDGRAAWLVMRDPCAGSEFVYTVYRIELMGTKEARVIGRELSLPLAREVVKRDRENLP